MLVEFYYSKKFAKFYRQILPPRGRKKRKGKSPPIAFLGREKKRGIRDDREGGRRKKEVL